MNRWTVLVLAFSLWSSCRISGPALQGDASLPLPLPSREFRAAWVASVANINWPSKPGLSVAEQQEEAIALLDLLQSHHYNAVILQVRPQCDALYDSKLEPWSYFLTGIQGQSPQPYYDPLHFWIDEAHQRGLELHAWLNPYRAHHTSSGEVTDSSIVRRKPELALPLKNGFWWLDPAHQSTQDHSYQVVMDILRRYDVDGIHFDDYFYPYPSYHDGADFPDDHSWRRYQTEGGTLDRSDWRRLSVNNFISRVYRGIKKNKPYVKFGLSPFGIWRPNHPPTISGFDQYASLYADARLWLQEGWIDYFTPQLYWPINQIKQSFPVLLRWWMDQNKLNRAIWPGLSIGRKPGLAGIDEVINQIMVSRGMLPQDKPGTVHWSIGPLVQSDSLVDAIFSGPYHSTALVPAMTHLSKKRPAKPRLHHQSQVDSIQFNWQASQEYVGQWILCKSYEGQWTCQVYPGDILTTRLPKEQKVIGSLGKKLNNAAIFMVDRFGKISDPSSIAPIR